MTFLPRRVVFSSLRASSASRDLMDMLRAYAALLRSNKNLGGRLEEGLEDGDDGCISTFQGLTVRPV